MQLSPETDSFQSDNGQCVKIEADPHFLEGVQEDREFYEKALNLNPRFVLLSLNIFLLLLHPCPSMFFQVDLLTDFLDQIGPCRHTVCFFLPNTVDTSVDTITTILMTYLSTV